MIIGVLTFLSTAFSLPTSRKFVVELQRFRDAVPPLRAKRANFPLKSGVRPSDPEGGMASSAVRREKDSARAAPPWERRGIPAMTNPHLSSAACVQAFLAHLGAERGFSPHTLAAYRRDLEGFLGFLEGAGRDLPDARREDVASFLACQARSGLSSSTLARRLACLRSLFAFLAAENQVAGNPAREVPMPRRGIRLPSKLRANEVERFLDDGPGGEMALRDRAILETFYATGLRVSELAGLSTGDVNLGVGFVRARGKGSKERVVPLGGPAREAVREYLGSVLGKRGDTPLGVQPLFLSRTGGRLGREAVFRLVKRAAARAGLSVRVSPHTLRHTFASHLVAGGADLRAVQEMLGHASVATTQVYTHVENRWLKDEHRRFHPRG